MPGSISPRNFRQKLNGFPYKIKIGYQISDQNKQSRVHICQWCLSVLKDDAKYVRILCSEEYGFPLSGVVNKQSCIILGTGRPQENHKVPQGAGLTMDRCTTSGNIYYWHLFLLNPDFHREQLQKVLCFCFFASCHTTPKTLFFNMIVLYLTLLSFCAIL